MKRKITSSLLEYFHSDEKKAFILKGTRQVGKTYIIEQFLRDNYHPENILKINFIRQNDILSLFEEENFSLNPDSIIHRLMLHPSYQNIQVPEKGRMAIFFDEIQESPKALTCLKFFAEQREKYDIYASGSYLGFATNSFANGDSYPIGYTVEKHLYGFDFEEFLWALGYKEAYVNNLKSAIADNIPLPPETHEEMMECFRKYIVIGSLPDSIQTYLSTKDFSKTRERQTNLYRDYCQEMNRHLINSLGEEVSGAYAKTMMIKNKAIFDSIPSQLRQQNKKFMFRRVSKGGRERMYIDSIEWLKCSSLILETDNTRQLSLYPSDYIDEESYKLFYFDTGILMTQFDSALTNDILYPLHADETNYVSVLSIGGIYENAVACILNKYTDGNSFYYHADAAHEIDFVLQQGKRLKAIEIKSGNNIKPNSLLYYMERNKENKDVDYIRVSQKQIRETNQIQDVPFYAFALIYSI